MEVDKMLRKGHLLVGAFALCASLRLQAQDPQQVVRQAVQTELTADQNDHSRWLYYEDDRKPGRSVDQWVAETREGNLRRVLELNGQPVPLSDQKNKMDSYLQDSGSRSKQRKNEQHDDEQAAELLRLLPDAFIWTYKGQRESDELLHFRPNPQFRPPDLESKVFAAMEGDMLVDAKQHRIVSLKGQLVHDVKLFGGFLGSLNAGGTFDVERRKTGGTVWQITETHVHIDGRVLLFKTISEQEDDVKTKFKKLAGDQDTTLRQAESDLLAQGG
jgi:hypothetical protein